MSSLRFGARARARLAVAAVATLGATVLLAVNAPTPAHADTVDTLTVDASQTTGAFRGGANGTLYGLGDNGVPSQTQIDGAHITNTSQKPPDGAQHPSGDALQVESSFFAGAGQDLYVYLQDEYPDFSYNGGVRPGDANGDGVWDYLPIVKAAVEKVATSSAHPENYIFIPFNEPDGGNWYANWSTMKSQFLADWSATYTTIESVYAEHGLGHAKIGGPGDAGWEATRSQDLLTYAKANSQLPDVFIWHELQSGSLANFRSHMTAYKSILSSLGLPNIPVNITEYGSLHDMGVPGKLLQWMSMFEDDKVDAQTAFWNYAGNLDDNSSRANGANGGWWLFKWYGDLAGSNTVQVTPPQLNVGSTLQGIGTVDAADRKVSVLFGGGSNNIQVNVAGLNTAAFGSVVHVQVRADRVNGSEGSSSEPPVVLSTDLTAVNGKVSVAVPNSDPDTAYQLIVTPVLAKPESVSSALVNTTEAEAVTITDASVYFQDPTNDWSFEASNQHDVGSFNKADSSATWTVTVPHTGNYRLSVVSGANQSPGQHALFVDGSFAQLIKYSADLGWTYRGTAEVTFPLTAGAHTLSVRASKDGTTVLPGADITLDRFDLYDITSGENAAYPATDARLAGGAALTYSNAVTAGAAGLSGAGSATFFTANDVTGYYTVTADYTTVGASDIAIKVNGRPVDTHSTTSAGTYSSSSRVFLAQGINEIAVTSHGGALLGDITTSRGADEQAADLDPTNVDRVEAESLALAGAAQVGTASAASNGSPDASGAVKYVGYLGNGAGNTMTLTRPASFGAGDYVLTLGYANAARNGGLNYNPQVVSRFLDISEAGGGTVRAAFRHNYSWDSFWDKSVPLSLTTGAGSLVMGNTTDYGPNVDTVTLARLVSGIPTTVQHDVTAPTVSLTSTPAAPNGTNGWFISPVTVNTSATDDLDPAPLVEASADGGAWAQTSSVLLATDGSHTVAVRATDASGNVSAVATFASKLDTTQPVSNVTVNSTTRTLTFVAADDTSGVSRIEYQNQGSSTWTTVSGPLTVGLAATTVSYRSVDNAGNVEQTRSVAVPKAGVSFLPSSATAALSPDSVSVGTTTTLTVNITGNGATPTGTVRVTDGSVQLASGALAGGRATIALKTAGLEPGVHTLTIDYSGSKVYGKSTATTTLTVVKANSTTTLKVAPSTVGYGGTVAASIRVTATGTTPTGTVTLSSGSTVIATGRLVNGAATIRFADTLVPGSYALAATYSGDATVASSTAAVPLTVNQVVSTVHYSIAPTPLTASSSPVVSVTATATPSFVDVDGTVTVTVNKGSSQISQTNGALTDGQAAITLPPMVAGSYTVTVAYSGSTTVASSSRTGTISVRR